MEEDPGTGAFEIKLVEFDAALFVGERVLEGAKTQVERKWHTGSYDPMMFDAGAVARAAFDW